MLIKKNVLILHPADKSACAFYRCHAVAMLLNSTAGGDVEVIVSRAEITDEYVLKYTAAVVFFRVTTGSWTNSLAGTSTMQSRVPTSTTPSTLATTSAACSSATSRPTPR